jgi:hypothetical protein
LSNPWQIYLNGEGQPKLTKLEMKRGMTANTKEIQGIIRDCFEYLYSNKLKNIEEIVKFLDLHDHTKLNQTIKISPKKKCPGPDGFFVEFYQILKKN